MKELLPDIERWRDAGKKVAIATVVQAYGSAPRRPGAKMAISQDGEFVGSVSGGCVENDVVEHARQVLEDDQARLVPYGISDDLAFNVGLACGGQIEVFIQPFGRAFPLGKPVAFAYTIEGPGVGNGLLAWEFGKHRGSLGQGEPFDDEVAERAIAALGAGAPEQVKFEDAPQGSTRVFVDTYPAQPTIVIFGGVHIGVALARLAKATDEFRVVVVDARGAWANDERFPEVDEIHVMHADDYLKDHQLGSNAYVAVLSHDPKLDDPALIGALQSRARFVGAIGSPKTQAARRERLATAGLTEEQIGRLHGPIGLNIGAQTPEEIGVAILAQMIAAKNGVSGILKLAPAQQLAAAGAR
ncbi:MAG TPA: XdhC family protein [Chloroflexota bacterium]|jgi:xanthine dehydrogenase accessory factor|nr:XdhC family protein [Chloroflexota bacterium]